MFYRVTGDGPAMVFIHGAGGSGRLFGNQFQAFRGHARCYFLDLPGHGGSPPMANLTIEAYARAVSDFIRELAQPVTLVGHSMGGAVALDVALSSAGPLNRLVLAGTGCRLPVAPKILSGLETGYDATLDSILRYCFTKSVDPELFQRARIEMGRVPREVVQADFQACNTFDRCTRLSEVTIPTLVICGEKDVMTPVSFSKQLQESIPNARLEIIPGASHMLMLEFPNRFNEVLNQETL